MNEKEFVDIILQLSRDNSDLEDKVEKQGYVFVKRHFRKLKCDLMSISILPYGTFEVGNWCEKKLDYKNRFILRWKDFGKVWFLE